MALAASIMGQRAPSPAMKLNPISQSSLVRICRRLGRSLYVRRSMHKLLARSFVAPFFFVFGVALLQFGCAYLRRGRFQYAPTHGGPVEIISVASNPIFYWTMSVGLLTFGALCLFLSAYAAVCLFRALASGSWQFRAPAFGLVMFVLGLIGIALASLLYMCSQR